MKITPSFTLFLFLLIVFGSFVTAQTQTVGELNIFYPKHDTYKIGENAIFEVQAFNNNGSIITNTDITCNINIFSPNGILKTDSLMINTNTFNKHYNYSTNNILGINTYNIRCNTSTLTGAISDTFITTYTGENNNNVNSSIFLIAYLLLFFGVASISLWISHLFNQPEYSTLRLVFFWMAIINILVAIGFFALNSDCASVGCSEIGRFSGWGITYFSSYLLFTVYVLWNYTFNKMKKSNEDWIVKK